MARKNRKDSNWNKPQEAAPKATSAQVEEKIDFDGWWAMRVAKIPMQHRKEIIRADFGGRGLSEKESVQSFDKALKSYGLELS